MTDPSLSEILQNLVSDPNVRRQEFYRYYDSKRVAHQLKQVELLRDVTGSKLAEIGSYLGFATGLFMSAGFKVQTIDAGPIDLLGELTPERHIPKDILDVTADDLIGQDVIVCCETLEHLHYPDAESALRTFANSSAQWLLISVPYRCLSVDVRVVKNPFAKLFKWIVKFPNKKNAEFKPHPDPSGHKWELGYKGHPLTKLTGSLLNNGWLPEKIDYVGTVQSVLILSQRKS